MHLLRSKPPAIAGALALVTTGFVAVTVSQADNAHAGTCLTGGNYTTVTLPAGGATRAPSSGYFTTSSKCRDINLRAGWYVTRARAVKVCFKTAGCQGHWTNIPAHGDWKVVASNVKDGTQYYFEFYTTGKWDGVAAD